MEHHAILKMVIDMDGMIEVSYVSDEELKQMKISEKFSFDSIPTFFAGSMGYKDMQCIRPVIKSKKMYQYAKKHCKVNNEGVEIFAFGEYPMDFDRPNQRLILDFLEINTKKQYHDLCNPEHFVDECFYGTKKYVVFPTFKWATWVRVKPVEWIIDDENQMLISRRKIASVPTDELAAKKVLNTIFLKDIISSGIKKFKHTYISKKVGVEENTELEEEHKNKVR